MQQYEIEPLFKNLHKRNKEDWEQARLVGYITAQVNSKKKLKMNDIIKFPWDDEKTEGTKEISNEDVERLKLRTKQFIENGNR